VLGVLVGGNGKEGPGGSEDVEDCQNDAVVVLSSFLLHIRKRDGE